MEEAGVEGAPGAHARSAAMLAKLEEKVLEQGFRVEEGWVRADWNVLGAYLRQRLAPKELDDGFMEVCHRWLERNRALRAPAYRLYETPHFLVLSAQERGEARGLCATAERVHGELERLVPCDPRERGHGKRVILVLANRESYYDYIAPFYPPGAFATSAGICLWKGYMHVAIPLPCSHLPAVVAHELTHVFMRPHEPPRWLDEGIAQWMERHLGGGKERQIKGRRKAEHLAYWRRVGIGAFFAGRTFDDPEDAR
jgi:hypothetical protein